MNRLLFVYGSLQSTYHNPAARRLRREAVLRGQGRLRGRLLCWSGYPLLQTTGRRDPIAGELWCLRRPRATWRWLDRYEDCHPAQRGGPVYRRTTRIVRDRHARPRLAWVYLGRTRRRGAPATILRSDGRL